MFWGRQLAGGRGLAWTTPVQGFCAMAHDAGGVAAWFDGKEVLLRRGLLSDCLRFFLRSLPTLDGEKAGDDTDGLGGAPALDPVATRVDAVPAEVEAAASSALAASCL